MKYYASEINKSSIKITQHNHPETIQLGDVRNINTYNFPQIDLLIAGSPCQGFSFAGNRLNFKHKESILFFEFVRLLKKLKPKYFLLENVKMKQEWLDIISKELGVEPIRINSELVSAQHRDRYYWTNIPGITQPSNKEIILNDVLDNVGEDMWLLRDKAKNRALNNSRSRIVNRDTKKCPALLLNQGKQATDSVSILEEDGTVRWLSRRECERLQTLPKGYTDSVAKCEAIKCMGDGWTVEVIKHIFSHIPKEFLEKEDLKVLSLFDGISCGQQAIKELVPCTNGKSEKYRVQECKVINCNNRQIDGDFGLENHRYGYCQIHKIEGTAEETTSFHGKVTE